MKKVDTFTKKSMYYVLFLALFGMVFQMNAKNENDFSIISIAQDTCAGISEWSATQVYTSGMEVTLNGTKYRARWWTQNQNPSTNSAQWSVWESLGSCSGGGGGGTNTAPSVSVTSPSNGASFQEGSSFTITADASDSDGSIAKVEFFNNGQSIGEDTSSPYAASVTNATPGSYTLTAVATDNEGATTTSAGISITITTTGGGGGGGDCDGIASFVVGETYTQDQEVANEGKKYRCDIPGWCSSTAGWAYAPGTGTYWEQAWTEIGDCGNGGGGGNTAPTVTITSPGNGSTYEEGTSVTITANASDTDGSVQSVEFFNGTSSLGTDTSSPYSISFNATADSYSLTAVATDNDGASTTSSIVSIRKNTGGGGGNGDLPARILNGYWHNFDNGSGITRLRDVSSDWDVINISFAVPTVSEEDGEIGFELDAAFSRIGYTTEDFKSDIRLKQSQGKKIIISIGGAEGTVRLVSANAAQKFTRSMISIIDEYGFDGLDIDFEGQSLSLNFGDTDFRNPTTPLIVNTINAVRGVCDNYGDDFILTMAPETFFVQLGYSFYGGISQGADRRAGAYLPVIHALRDKLTFLQVQYYNSGPITALNDQFVQMGNSNFYVALVDMLLKGFPITKDSSKFFPALRQDQILIGVPATVNAGGGFTGAEGVIRAMKYLIEGQSFGGSYTLDQTYPNLRGVMSWSTNWDEFGGLTFSSQVRAYLDGLGNKSFAIEKLGTDTVQVLSNPVRDGLMKIQFDLSATTSAVTIKLYNIAGVKVLEKTVNNLQRGSTSEAVDISTLDTGIYLYTISLDGEKINGKVLVK